MKKLFALLLAAAVIYSAAAALLFHLTLQNSALFIKFFSPSASDINLMSMVALILLAAFMVFILLRRRHME